MQVDMYRLAALDVVDRLQEGLLPAVCAAILAEHAARVPRPLLLRALLPRHQVAPCCFSKVNKFVGFQTDQQLSGLAILSL